MSDPYLTKLLGEHEEILLETRRHWFVLLEHIFVEIVLSIITVIVVTVLLVIGNQGPIAAFGYFLLIIPLVSLLRDVMIWSNHKYIVTNLRVIQLMGIFNKNVIDSSLEKVNDVKMDQSFFGRMFNFGDIEVLTASEMGINRFTRIGDPVKFKTAMLNAKVRLEEHGLKLNSSATVEDIPGLISRLGELRERGLITQHEFDEKKAKLLAKL
jgi:uncharacterized membrane protein YdbT with pleckstrin-like domain